MGDGSSDVDRTVVFVDLVAFTSMTDIHGDLAAADAADVLTEIVRTNLDDQDRLVKTLGDGVLFTSPSPATALLATAEIIEALHDRRDGMDARAGAHHGPVVERSADVFGSTVNLAARAASLAHPGRIVATRQIAEAVDGVDLTAIPLGEKQVRGFVEPIELFEIDPCAHDVRWSADPVCGMRLPDESIEVWRAFRDATIGFCSERCRAIFDDAPLRFIAPD